MLYVDGSPAFVLGLYTTSGYSTTRSTYARGNDGWGNDRIAQAPMNMLINYHLGRAPMPALGVYMDELQARGMRYLQTVNFYHRADGQYREIEYAAAKQGEDELNRWVAHTLGAHPGLAGFYVMDERPPRWCRRCSGSTARSPPPRPAASPTASSGTAGRTRRPLWRDALDVMGLDPYPIVKPSGQNDLAMVGEWTRLGQDAVKGSRPLWMVLQYFPLPRPAAGRPRPSCARCPGWPSSRAPAG